MLRTFSGRRASQNEFELRKFVKYLCARGVKRYLEIGARHGDTFHEVMLNLPAGSYGLAVDLPGGLWGTPASVKALRAACEDLRARGYAIDVLLGDSTSPAVIEQVRAKGPFDAALIDGDHSYEGVSRDWANYHPMAGAVALHDIVGVGEVEKVTYRPVEVPRFWAELKKTHTTVLEFVDHSSTMGIGVCDLRS